MDDKLDKMFDLRKQFMAALHDGNPGACLIPPVDLTNKQTQQHMRDLALRGVEEVFESLAHIKNWKPHRVTEIKEFNQEAFKEEMVDALNYFFSLLILADVSADDLYNAYAAKDKVIHERIKNNY